MRRMPTLFIPHGGGPCFFMDWKPSDTWDNMANYLRRIQSDIGQKPKAIVVISGHWEEPVITIQDNAAPSLLFDYYGFPDNTYLLEYPAAGSPQLTSRIQGLLIESGIDSDTDTERGFDHGVFVPLKVAFPDSDIPIVQMSLRADLDPGAHIATGKALEPLRDEGVLILGSGMTYHNMQVMMRNMQSGGGLEPGAQEFDHWLTEAVTDPDYNKRNQKLTAWEKAPSAGEAHPKGEHLLPLHVIAGAAGSDTGKKMLEDQVLGAVESAFQFG
jgi:aromatic ring-opening dioxygenase catalytic subunit (LigB family)